MRLLLGSMALLVGLLAAACTAPTPTPTPLPPTPTATPSPTATPAPPSGGALVRVVPATLTLAPGELALVQVEVLVEGIGVSAAELTITFSPEIVRVIGVEAGSFLGENPVVGLQSIDRYTGEVRIALARVGRARVPTPNGTLVVVNLVLLKEAFSDRRTPIHLSQATLVDQEFREIPEVRLLDGEVRVVAP